MPLFRIQGCHIDLILSIEALSVFIYIYIKHFQIGKALVSYSFSSFYITGGEETKAGPHPAPLEYNTFGK